MAQSRAGRPGEFRTMLLDRFLDTSSERMARWFDLISMTRTLANISVSEIFHDRFDYRILAALSHRTRAEPAQQESGPFPRFRHHGSYFEYQVEESPGGAPEGAAPEDAASEDAALWFDYAADTGDGFNSSYWVACQLAQRRLSVRPSETGEGASLPPLELPRGRFLILGGDQVYPSASREAYENRFIKPFEAASYSVCPPDRLAAPHLYAIPGNHDWYDGLAGFMNVFGDRRAIGGWRTVQQVSYFAIKLPHDVWIFAVDIGLGGELDDSQVLYFQNLVRTQMRDTDAASGTRRRYRVILCMAEPDWVKARPNVGNLRDGLFYLERKIAQVAFEPNEQNEPLDVRVVLRLAGDLHHYRRHESDEPRHPTEDEAAQLGPVPTDEALRQLETMPDGNARKDTVRRVVNITAGGGGAFLHPTHETNRRRRDGSTTRDIEQHPRGLHPVTFRHCAAYPSVEESKRLTWGNLWFFRWNVTLALTLGFLVYAPLLLIGYSILHVQEPGRGLLESPSPRSLLLAGILWFVYSLILGSGCARFAAGTATGELGATKHGRARAVRSSWSRRRKARFIGWAHGLLHGALLGLFLFGGWALYLRVAAPYIEPYLGQRRLSFLVPLLLSLPAGLLHSLLTLSLLGAYLLVALNTRLHLHSNDAFASLRIQDYKDFLRIRVTRDQIDVYAIGIRKVPRSWRFIAEEPESPEWRRLEAQALAASPQPSESQDWQPLFLPADAAPGAPAAQDPQDREIRPFLIERVTIPLK
ncbi:MAG: hypothetical protein U1A78_27095 [Polyangia bacterium]